MDDPEYLKSQGHDVDSADDSDSDSDHVESRKRSPSPQPGPSKALDIGPHQPQQGRSLIGRLTNMVFGSQEERVRVSNMRAYATTLISLSPQQLMQQRYLDRRQVFEQQRYQGVPSGIAGPMYPAGGLQMYAPPPMLFGRRAERKAVKRARRAARRAARRGYAVPVVMSPSPVMFESLQQAPLFEYGRRL